MLGRNVVSSEGDLVQPGKGITTWHRGTSVVKTPQGERTISHLQSLKLPGQHFYFNRRLSDEEVAGLVSEREKAHKLPGYAGEVHPMEALLPTWGATKKAMIINRLYWPSPEATWARKKEKPHSATPAQKEPVTMRTIKPARPVPVESDQR
jgi:hypothetical protein